MEITRNWTPAVAWVYTMTENRIHTPCQWRIQFSFVSFQLVTSYIFVLQPKLNVQIYQGQFFPF